MNTDRASKNTWLVKVPHFVAKQWKEIYESTDKHTKDSEQVLGTIRINEEGAEDNKFLLTLNNEATAELPQEYTMTNSVSGPKIVAFSENQGSWACEGVVQYRLEANSHGQQNDAAYRKLSRERHQQASLKIRTTKKITGTQITNIRVPKGIQALAMKRKEEGKRVAIPRDELEPRLFELFEKRSHWKFASLQQETQQPVQHLKSVLLEIAQQNKFGPYRDLWSLKKEFRLQNANEDADTDAAGAS